jgi:hypothetical protein
MYRSITLVYHIWRQSHFSVCTCFSSRRNYKRWLLYVIDPSLYQSVSENIAIYHVMLKKLYEDVYVNHDKMLAMLYTDLTMCVENILMLNTLLAKKHMHFHLRKS